MTATTSLPVIGAGPYAASDAEDLAVDRVVFASAYRADLARAAASPIVQDLLARP